MAIKVAGLPDDLPDRRPRPRGTVDTHVQAYFYDPHASSQAPTGCCAIPGRLQDLSTLVAAQLDVIVDEHNERSRNMLHWTPPAKFSELGAMAAGARASSCRPSGEDHWSHLPRAAPPSLHSILLTAFVGYGQQPENYFL